MIARLNLGGPARCVINLSHRLESRGFETMVAAGQPAAGEGDLTEELVAAGGEVAAVPDLRRNLNPYRDLRAYYHLRRLVRTFKPHIVHTHTAKAGFLGRWAARGPGPEPIRIHTYHGHVLDGYFGRLRSALFRSLERRLARNTHALIAVAPSVMEELVSRHRVGAPSQYHVIPSGFPELTLENAQSLRSELVLDEAVVVGVAARMVPVKGILFFLEALPQLLEAVPSLKVVLAGDGPLRPQVESLANRPPLKGRVLILGNRTDMARIFKTLDILVIPSFKEGLPTVLLEAAAAGVPVAASRIPGVQDLAKDGEEALLFEPGTKEELCRAVNRLVEEPELRVRLAERALEKAASRVPNYEEVAEAHARLYHDLMNRGAP